MTKAVSNTPQIVGLTGNIGSGKSAVADCFASLGATIIDADLLARKAVEPNSPALGEIVSSFGAGILTDKGELNRKQLAGIIYSDPQARQKLEQILHPQVRALFLSELESVRQKQLQPKLIVFVIPLLFEGKISYPEIEKVLLVSSSKKLCLERIQKRDNRDLTTAEKIYSTQLPPEKKEKLADYVIYNNSTIEALKLEVEKIFKLLCPDSL